MEVHFVGAAQGRLRVPATRAWRLAAGVRASSYLVGGASEMSPGFRGPLYPVGYHLCVGILASRRTAARLAAPYRNTDTLVAIHPALMSGFHPKQTLEVA